MKLQDGRVIRRHIDHIVLRSTQIPDKSNDDWIDIPDVTESKATDQSTITVAATPPLRRSTRVSVPPKRYGQENTT